MDWQIVVRILVALALALALSVHGIKKKSLDLSGSVAACLVGFISLAVSYRFGLLLLLFYYSSSKLTKLKEDVKAKLEDDYAVGGQRNYIQVLANSLLSTAVALLFFAYIGEDQNLFFPTTAVTTNSSSVVDLFGYLRLHKDFFASQLTCMYIAHFATANGDTWASEVGILSPSRPRLVTTLFIREVPPGTNGGMSFQGTIASILGGGFIGLIYFLMGLAYPHVSTETQGLVDQSMVVLFGAICGFAGSLVDSLLGATLQASYYSKEKKKIVKNLPSTGHNHAEITHICGINVLSNEAVNFLSICIMMILSWCFAPVFFCAVSASYC